MTKIDIISGFLGAGKTTFIQKLLSDALKGENVVLIENEFGEIGVDSGFLKNAGIEIREMNQGCICCSLVGDFESSLKEVIEQYHPDRILIEPSGVGKLSDIISAVKAVAENLDVKLDGAVTVVDATKAKLYNKNFGEFFDDQIRYATSVVLSRMDIASSQKAGEAVDIVRGVNPHANLITTALADLSGEKLLEIIGKEENLEEELLAEVKAKRNHHHQHHHHHEEGESCGCGCHEEGHEHHHHHHEGCGCGHDHDADEVFESIGLEVFKKVDRSFLEEILEEMAEGCAYGGVVRAKGMLACTDGTWVNFDLVPEQVEIREAGPENIGKFVVIGTDLQKDKIRALFQD